MATKVLSIEIGKYETRVLEMDYKTKAPKIHHFFKVSTPEYMLRDGSVELDQEFVAQMRAKFVEKGIKTKKVIFVLNSGRIANREVSIPLVKENKIHELLVTNSSEYFPVDLVQYQLVHRIVEKNTEENKYKLSVLAVPNEMIKSYEVLAEALGLQIEALDYIGNSVAQGMMKLLPDEVKVSVKLDELSALITIINGTKVELQRIISYGYWDVVETVMENPAFGEKKSFDEALTLLRTQNCVEQEDVAESLVPLIGNIRRILDYYISRNQDVSLNEIWMLGTGARFMGMSELLTAELNIPVMPLEQLPNQLAVLKSVQEGEFPITKYAACMAATIAPLNFNLSNGKKGGLLAKVETGELGYSVVVCGVCLCVAIVLLLYSFISTSILKSENAKLKAQIEELNDVKITYNTYVSTKAQYEALTEMYGLTETPDDKLLAFLAEMEEKMPSEVSVASMTAGPEGVNMNITVSSKSVAAKVLMQLRDFETLSTVDTPQLAEMENDGRTTVTFPVYCTYALDEE